MNDDRKFAIQNGILDDERRLIAALKLQRWDVVKWAVTVNMALCAAAIAVSASEHFTKAASMHLFWLAGIVTVIGEMLLLYYNRRLTKTREDSRQTKDHLTALGATFIDTSKPPKFYDWQELLIFSLILRMSFGANWIIWVLSG
jgi:hypothetical protein